MQCACNDATEEKATTIIQIWPNTPTPTEQRISTVAKHVKFSVLKNVAVKSEWWINIWERERIFYKDNFWKFIKAVIIWRKNMLKLRIQLNFHWD